MFEYEPTGSGEYLNETPTQKELRNSCYKYSYRIFYQARQDSQRQRMLEDAADGLGVHVGVALFDKLLELRLELVAEHKRKLAEAAELERQAAEIRKGQ